MYASHSQKALDVEGGSTNDGARVIQYTFHGGNNQLWWIYNVGGDYYVIESV